MGAEVDKKKVGALFVELVEVMAKLRSSEGCLWDREQTHESIKRNLIEESYEAVEAIENGDFGALCEELGDVLLQVVFHAQMALEAGRFSIEHVIEGIIDKIKRRHPHIFSSVRVSSSHEILTRWEKIKKREKGEERGQLSGIPRSLPALHLAYEVGSRAARLGFDWERALDVIGKLSEELEEIRAALNKEARADLEEEMGDFLFAAVNLARKLDIDPESALKRTVDKFVRRYEQMEVIARQQGRSLDEMSLAEMDEIWNRVKEEEK